MKIVDRLQQAFPNDMFSYKLYERTAPPGQSEFGVVESVVTTISEDHVGCVGLLGKLSQDRYIPMMDFSLPATIESTLTVDEARRLSAMLVTRSSGRVERWLIVVSGRSYHAYGLDILSWVAYEKLLLNCLRYEDEIDAKWIGNVLARKNPCLRINRYYPRHKVDPFIIYDSTIDDIPF